MLPHIPGFSVHDILYSSFSMTELMILNIDTSKESPEELRRIARFLEEIAGVPLEVREQPVEVSAEIFSVFDNSADAPKAAAPTPAPTATRSTDRVVPYE